MTSWNLRAGDLMLYSGTGFFSRLIKIKTWSSISHTEIFIGEGQSVASRNGKGVGTYPIRVDDLRVILRPRKRLRLVDGMAWHNLALGQRYDWFGLLRFFTLGKQSLDKQFCSEHSTRFYRACGFEPFTEHYDADLVSPGLMLASPRFTRTWTYDAGSS